MAKTSLLCKIFNEVYQKEGTKYCMICFRSFHERRLVDDTNVMKFKYYRQSNRLRSKDYTRNQNMSTFSNNSVCYVCDRQAAAAIRFCIAVNLSNKLHYLFSRMKINNAYRKEIHALLVDNVETDGMDMKEPRELQQVLNKLRATNTLLQTETLILGNDVTSDNPSPATNRDRKLRDLFSFETKPVTEDDSIAQLNNLSSQSHIMTKTIFLEEDEVNEEPHPIAIIHNPTNDPQTDTIIPTLTNSDTSSGLGSAQNIIQNQMGMLMQPLLLNFNGNKNSLNNGPNLVINPLGSNMSVPILSQSLNNERLIPINNLNVNNQFILPVSQNVNGNSVVIGQNIDQNSVLGQNIGKSNVVFGQNIGKSNVVLGQNIGKDNVVLGQNIDKNSVLGSIIDGNKIVIGQNIGKNNFLAGQTIDGKTVMLSQNIDKNNVILGQIIDGNKLILAQNIDKNSLLGQNTYTLLQNNLNQSLNQNQLIISSVTSKKITKNQSTIQNTKTDNKMEVVTAGVKRSDSECQVDRDSAPRPVKTGKIDWEDKIPMDVISCVSKQDPSIRSAPAPRPPHGVCAPPALKDAVDSFIITDVKSISEMPPEEDVIDLC